MRDALPDGRLLVVDGGDLGRRDGLDDAVVLQGGEAQVEVEGAAGRAEDQADAAAGSLADGGREVDGVAAARSAVPVVGPPPAAPAPEAMLGKARPVGLPRACDIEALPPHWTPMRLVEVGGGLDDAALDQHLRDLRCRGCAPAPRPGPAPPGCP